MKLRVGFIGVGGMGRSHLRTFTEHFPDRVSCVALCDPHQASIDQALKIAPTAKIIEDSRTLAQSPEVDAVVISTPNHLHVDNAIAALEAGKDVMMEKPVATTVDDCFRLVEATDRADALLMVGHELRYAPYFQAFGKMIEDGVVGAPHMVWCKEFRPPFLKKVDDWIQDSRRSGGALVDKTCHFFDILNGWIKATPVRVSAFGQCSTVRILNNEHEVIDHAAVNFVYDSGVTGSLLLCMFAPDQGDDCLQLSVIGDEGMIQTQMSTRDILVRKRTAKTPEIVHVPESDRALADSHHGFLEEHDAFLDAVTSRKETLTSVRNCVHGTLLSILAEQSIKEGRIIPVPDLTGKDAGL